jgi:hypothetical protein
MKMKSITKSAMLSTLVVVLVGVGIIYFQYVIWLRVGEQGATVEGNSSEVIPVDALLSITLDAPEFVRLGDTGIAKLTVTILDQERFNKEYLDQGILFESRLTMDGVAVVPNGLVSETYAGGESLTFYWKVTPEKVGKRIGQVWLYLRSGVVVDQDKGPYPLSAQRIEIEGRNSFGLNSDMVRVAGVLTLFFLIAYFAIQPRKKA